MRPFRSFLWLSVFAVMGFGFPGQAFSQTLFQNNNQACEGELVLCDSTDCPFPPARGVSCRNINRDGTFVGADFNGDGFTDCVAERPHSFTTDDVGPVQLNASVLINRGAAATACSPGPGDQFSPALDYNLSGIGFSNSVGTVMTGILSGGNSDFTVPNVGIGSENMVTAANTGSGFGPGGGSLVTVNVPWDVPTHNQRGFADNDGQRSAALFDCNGDDLLDSVIAVEDSSPSPVFVINVLQNDGSGLQSPTGANPFNTHVSTDENNFAVLTVADFDGDLDLDVAVAMDTSNANFAPTANVVTVCLNDGSCGFTCPPTPTLNLQNEHPGQDVATGSIEAGDFNGDGFADLVVSEPNLSASDPIPTPEASGVQYYFGNNAAGFPNTLFVTYTFPGSNLGTLTTGCYNNDNVRDVAVAMSFSESPPISNVGVLTSDGAGGVHAPLPLFTATLGAANLLDGVDSADFDNQGGDDIIAIMNVGGSREAVIYMNSLETVSAIAGADQIADLNVPTAISGASCSVSPEITGDPARFETLWTLSPPAGASLGGANTLTPTFTATANGAYTLTLSCRTRCNEVVTDTKRITVGAVVPTPTPRPTATPVPFSGTQGGCLANLNPGGEGSFAFKAGYVFALLMPLFLMWIRRRRDV